jgi:tRNA dimethylallyltransferase
LDPRSDPLRGLRLRAIVGATGVGKSALALALARRHGLELVSLDSMQVYRGLDIGTAKPDAGERALAPHHMLDCADPRERYDASRFLGDLGRVLEGLAARGATPLFVGGTGFYLKLLVNGLAPDMPGDEGVRARLRERLALEGQERLHGELLRLDPPTALRIHPNDHYRLLRALEIHALTGNAPSALKTQWAAPARPARLVWLDCEVAELDARIRARAEAMFAAGWAAEARRLEEAGLLGPTASAALGYREAARVARGELPLDAAVDAIALATRQFARRQRTWWRKFDAVRLEAAADAPGFECLCQVAALALELHGGDGLIGGDGQSA